MHPTVRPRRRPSPALALAAGITALTLGSPPAAVAQEAALVIQSAGVDAMMPDERDATLRRVLELLPERLLELPDEFREFPQLPPPVVRSVIAGLTSPMSLSLDVSAAPAPGEPPTINALLTVQPQDPAVADALARLVAEFLNEQGAPVRPSDIPGMNMTQAPFGTLAFGARMDGDRPTFVLGVNHVGTSIPPIAGVRLPDGVAPAFALRLDTRRLGPLLDAMAEADPSGREMARIWQEFGLGGDDGLQVTMAHGYAADRAHTVVGLDDYAALAERMGTSRELTIPMAEYRAVPRDAVFVEMSAVRLSGLGDMLEQLMATAGAPPNFWEEAERELGFHPRTDLLDHLGDTVTVYRSDATGGGGMMSLVGLVGLGDPARVAETHAMLVRRVNDDLGPQTQGYVSIRPWTADGQDLFTLSFNGLPVPLQLTWGIQGSRLVIGGSPMAVLAAMQQARAPESSILDRPEVVAMAGGSLEGLVSMRYVDTPRAAARGYGTASLLATALANAVRSPRADARDRGVGMPMPTYAEFVRDVKPMVAAGSWDGEAFVVRMQSDRSMMVSLAGAVESIGGVGGLFVAGATVGAIMPALEQARDTATVVKSQAQVRQIVMGMQVHAADNEGRWPTSLDQLVAAEFLDRMTLESPFGPAWDDGPDFGYRAIAPGEVAQPSRTMVVIDRAMFLDRFEANVGFADGHVELLDYDELVSAFERPENTGAAEAFGIADEFP